MLKLKNMLYTGALIFGLGIGAGCDSNSPAQKKFNSTVKYLAGNKHECSHEYSNQTGGITLEGTVLKEGYDPSYRFVMDNQGKNIIIRLSDNSTYGGGDMISGDDLALLIEEGTKVRVYYNPGLLYSGWASEDYKSGGALYTVFTKNIEILER